LRFYNLSDQSYWMDEGYTVNAVISGMNNGFVNGSSVLDSGEKYFCPLYCYPTAKIIQFFDNQNPFYFRFLACFFGIIFIFITYFFTKNVFKNEKVAILSTFFVTFSYWQIAWSRQARWYTMLEVFFVLSLFSFYIFLKNENKKIKVINFLLSIIFSILAIITHRLAYLLPIILILWYFIETKFSFKKIFFIFLSFSGVILFTEFILNLNFISNASKNIIFHYNLPYYLNFYLRNYWIFIILIIYGYFNADKNLKNKIILLLSPFLIYLFFLSFFTKIVHYRYLFHTTWFFYILASAVFVDILKDIKNNKQKLVFLSSFIFLFFISKQGIIFPQDFYLLEADNPKYLNRSYYAYTPQPDFNSAYVKIKENIKKDEIVISSHPHFNKIFLETAGYWIKYDYLGIEDFNKKIKEDKEYYVGAMVVNDLEELKKLIDNKHGYIIFDLYAIDGRIDKTIVQYIQENLDLFFFKETNVYSKIFVYKFP